VQQKGITEYRLVCAMLHCGEVAQRSVVQGHEQPFATVALMSAFPESDRQPPQGIPLHPVTSANQGFFAGDGCCRSARIELNPASSGAGAALLSRYKVRTAMIF
jgi:hypothetical protein